MLNSLDADFVHWLIELHHLARPYWPAILTASLLMALASLLLIPLLFKHLPADHFVATHSPRPFTLGFALGWMLRNVLALLLFAAGFLMLFLPGQGLLTMLLAIVIADLPGKQRLERWLLRRPLIFQGANWIRKRYHRPPFIHPDAPPDDH